MRLKMIEFPLAELENGEKEHFSSFLNHTALELKAMTIL